MRDRSLAADVLHVGQPPQHGGHGGLHDQLYLSHPVHAGPLPVHRHTPGDAASSGNDRCNAHSAACATVSVQLLYLFSGTCLEMLQGQVMAYLIHI